MVVVEHRPHSMLIRNFIEENDACRSFSTLSLCEKLGSPCVVQLKWLLCVSNLAVPAFGMVEQASSQASSNEQYENYGYYPARHQCYFESRGYNVAR